MDNWDLSPLSVFIWLMLSLWLFVSKRSLLCIHCTSIGLSPITVQSKVTDSPRRIVTFLLWNSNLAGSVKRKEKKKNIYTINIFNNKKKKDKNLTTYHEQIHRSLCSDQIQCRYSLDKDNALHLGAQLKLSTEIHLEEWLIFHRCHRLKADNRSRFFPWHATTWHAAEEILSPRSGRSMDFPGG